MLRIILKPRLGLDLVRTTLREYIFSEFILSCKKSQRQPEESSTAQIAFTFRGVSRSASSLKQIVEFFTNSKCERRNHLVKVISQRKFIPLPRIWTVDS